MALAEVVEPDVVQDIPAEKQLERKAVTHADAARALAITDQVSYDRAAESLKSLATLKNEIEQHHAPLKKAAYDSWQTVIAAEKKLLQPVADAVDIVKRKITSWTLEQERIRQEAERKAREEAARLQREQEEAARREQERLQAEQRARDEEARLAAAIQAEAEGATAVEIEHVLETPAIDTEPVFVPPPPPPVIAAPVAPTFQRASGLSKPRDNWKAQVVDKQALIAAAAKDPQYSVYLDVNQGALDRLAKIQKTLMSVPGVRVYNDPSISVRRG